MALRAPQAAAPPRKTPPRRGRCATVFDRIDDLGLQLPPQLASPRFARLGCTSRSTRTWLRTVFRDTITDIGKASGKFCQVPHISIFLFRQGPDFQGGAAEQAGPSPTVTFECFRASVNSFSHLTAAILLQVRAFAEPGDGRSAMTRRPDGCPDTARPSRRCA